MVAGEEEKRGEGEGEGGEGVGREGWEGGGKWRGVKGLERGRREERKRGKGESEYIYQRVVCRDDTDMPMPPYKLATAPTLHLLAFSGS